jgi:hypothetical protein
LQAEESLLSDWNKNELLIINLAAVWAEGILIPGLHDAWPLPASLKPTI